MSDTIARLLILALLVAMGFWVARQLGKGRRSGAAKDRSGPDLGDFDDLGF